MISNVLAKFKRKEFVQNLWITIASDIVTIILALIVAYYFLIFTY